MAKDKNYDHMSSKDMAKAIDKYGQKVSPEFLMAVSRRLMRNAAILSSMCDTDITDKADSLKHFVHEFVTTQSAESFANLALLVCEDKEDVHKAIRLKALHDAAVLTASIQGCPHSTGKVHCQFTTCDRSSSKAAECWFEALKETL